MSEFIQIREYPNYSINKNGQILSNFNNNILKPMGSKYCQFVKLYDDNKNFEKVNISDLKKQYWPTINKNHFIVFYKINDSVYRTFDPFSNKFEDQLVLDIPNQIKFYMMKGYTTSDEGLKQYCDDFSKDCDDLKNNDVLNIYYSGYYSHFSAVEMTFRRLCKGSYEQHLPIDLCEFKWQNKCFNAGIMYCEKGIHKSYAYDFKAFYPSIMSSQLKIPYKGGQNKFLSKLPNTLQYGYYRAKITCNDDNFKKIFAFSKNDTYLNASIEFARKYKDQFNVSIDLIIDEKPNAYLYEESDMVTLNSIFGNWYNTLIKLKTKFPKNKIVKHLLSSLWGTLSRMISVLMTKDKFIQLENFDDEKKYFIKDIRKFDNLEMYDVVNCQKCTKYNLRLKSWITAYGRNIVAETVLHDINACVRICVDGIVFNRKQNFDIPNLVLEKKNCGLIDWKNVTKKVIMDEDSEFNLDFC